MGDVGTHTLGSVLRAMREAAGLSQEELAERATLSPHAISALERGTRTRPYPHTLRALAAALELDDEQRTTLLGAVPPRAARPAPGAVPARSSRALPTPATPLIGRDDDVARVGDLLRASRLVTLSGPGGVGKTRLALAAATAVQERYADGVRLVELAPLLEVGQVLPAVAEAVGAVRDPGRSVADDLVDRLRGQDLLLVLDNVEHLLDAAPHVAALVEAVPDLTVLTTSRAPLRVRGETEYAVDPPGGARPSRRVALPRCHAAPGPCPAGQPRMGLRASRGGGGHRHLRTARRPPARPRARCRAGPAARPGIAARPPRQRARGGAP